MRWAIFEPTEYSTYGLAADTTDDWITIASALIEATAAGRACSHAICRADAHHGGFAGRAAQLSSADAARPATLPLVAIQVRYGRPRRGEMPDPMLAQSRLGVLYPRQLDRARPHHRRL